MTLLPYKSPGMLRNTDCWTSFPDDGFQYVWQAGNLRHSVCWVIFDVGVEVEVFRVPVPRVSV